MRGAARRAAAELEELLADRSIVALQRTGADRERALLGASRARRSLHPARAALPMGVAFAEVNARSSRWSAPWDDLAPRLAAAGDALREAPAHVAGAEPTRCPEARRHARARTAHAGPARGRPDEAAALEATLAALAGEAVAAASCARASRPPRAGSCAPDAVEQARERSARGAPRGRRWPRSSPPAEIDRRRTRAGLDDRARARSGAVPRPARWRGGARRAGGAGRRARPPRSSRRARIAAGEPRADRGAQRAARPASSAYQAKARSAAAARGPRRSPTLYAARPARAATRRRRTSARRPTSSPLPGGLSSEPRPGGAAMTCEQPGCTGTIVDGYCDVCGMAPRAGRDRAAPPRRRGGRSRPSRIGSGHGARAPARRTAAPARRRVRGAARRRPRRRARRRRTATRRARSWQDPQVAEARRFCARCGEPVGRGARRRARAAPRASAASAARRSRSPRSSPPATLVAGQYEVVGCLAHGGMGWIYLARDHNVVRPLGGAQGPAQHRRRRRDGRRARRAALPGRGRAPEHRQDPQLRPARAARATSSWSTSAARA